MTRSVYPLVLAVLACICLAAGPAAADTPSGQVDKEAIRAHVTAHKDQIRTCYESALVDAPELEGEVVIRFEIDADGLRGAAVDSSTLGSPAVEACLVDVVGGWFMEPPSGGGTVVVRYPFRFASSE